MPFVFDSSIFGSGDSLTKSLTLIIELSFIFPGLTIGFNLLGTLESDEQHVSDKEGKLWNKTYLSSASSEPLVQLPLVPSILKQIECNSPMILCTPMLQKSFFLPHVFLEP